MRVKSFQDSKYQDKNIAPSNSFSADLERILYACPYLATRIVLAGLLVFYQPRNKQAVSFGNRLDKSSLVRACPLSNIIPMGQPNTPYHLCDMRSVQSKLAASCVQVSYFTTPLITHRIFLSEIEEAYRIFENKFYGVIKVAIMK